MQHTGPVTTTSFPSPKPLTLAGCSLEAEVLLVAPGLPRCRGDSGNGVRSPGMSTSGKNIIQRNEISQWQGGCERTVPGGPCVSKGSWPQFVTLPADTNHPGSQEDAVSYWQSPHSLVRDVVSVAKITVAHGCRSRASLPLGRAIKTSWLALPLYSLGTPGSQCGVRAFPCSEVVELDFNTLRKVAAMVAKCRHMPCRCSIN